MSKGVELYVIWLGQVWAKAEFRQRLSGRCSTLWRRSWRFRAAQTRSVKDPFWFNLQSYTEEDFGKVPKELAEIPSGTGCCIIRIEVTEELLKTWYIGGSVSLSYCLSVSLSYLPLFHSLFSPSSFPKRFTRSRPSIQSDTAFSQEFIHTYCSTLKISASK